MRIAAFALLLLFSASEAWAECKPADAKTLALAERKASDARYKAEQAEATAVKSGNPGASLRAQKARAEARNSEQELEKLKCQEANAPKASSVFQDP